LRSCGSLFRDRPPAQGRPATFPVEVSSRGSTIDGTRTSISIVRDITERMRAEEALVAAHGRNRPVLESIADAFYSLETGGVFVAVNPAAERAPFGRQRVSCSARSSGMYSGPRGHAHPPHYFDAVEKRSQEHYEATVTAERSLVRGVSCSRGREARRVSARQRRPQAG